MLFYVDKMDKSWELARNLYDSKELLGIAYIKIKIGKSGVGVMNFFCGPSYDESLVRRYGENLIEKMQYTFYTGNMRFTNYNLNGELGKIYTIVLPNMTR